MLHGVFDWLQIGGMKVVNDKDITNAVTNCYKNICWNDYSKSTIFNCKLDITRIGNVFWAYINLFVNEKTQTAKYYYNEPKDANDSYRKQIVELVSKVANQDKAFTEKVLNYIYSGCKRGIIPSYIHKPREAEKFKDPNFFYSPIFKTVFSITDIMKKTLNEAATTLTTVVTSVGQGVQEIIGAASWLARNIIWVAGGVLVVGGVLVYKNRETVLKNIL